MLGTVTLIAGSFLIGRFVGVSQDDNDDKKDNNTSEVANTETSDVFDSTDEEIEAIKEEQEQLEQENEEKIEEVKEELAQEAPTKFDVVAPFGQAGTPCEFNIFFNEGANEPNLGFGNQIIFGENPERSSGIYCDTKNFEENGITAGREVDVDELKPYFVTETANKLEKAFSFGVKSGTDYMLKFAGLENEVRLFRHVESDNLSDYKIQLKIAEENMKQIVTTETYTNPFLTDFKLVYPSDWEFGTSTKTSYFSSSLLDRSITLSKGDITIDIRLHPFSDQGRFYNCGAQGPSRYEVQRTLAGGIKEYILYYGIPGSETSSNVLSYAIDGDERSGCDIINTSIKESNINDYEDEDDNDSLEYAINVGIDLPQNENPSNQTNLEEARKIIENSVLR